MSLKYIYISIIIYIHREYLMSLDDVVYELDYTTFYALNLLFNTVYLTVFHCQLTDPQKWKVLKCATNKDNYD